jgi:glycosyltransferase involved in cell wall biosynthesis
MNIVFISPYPPRKDGLARYTKQLAEQFEHDGHAVTAIDSDSIRFSLQAMRALYRRLQEFQPDVVHVQYTIAAFGLTALPLWSTLRLARKRLGFRLVVTLHEVKRETALLGPLGRLYISRIARLADRITVHTREASTLLTQRCQVPRNKIYFIPHPLYAYEKTGTTVSAWRKELGLGKQRIVLCFGYIHVDKGIDYLIRALALAKQADKSLDDVMLVIAGSVRIRNAGPFKLFEKKDHDYEAKLRKLVVELNLSDSVRFAPYIPDNQVANCFQAATCVVLPYTNLEQSGVLNIALGCRTPIIASKLGGLSETLAGTVALVPPADDASLARKLGVFLTDPAVRKSLVASYKDVIATRTVSVVTTEFEALYQKVLKQGRA